jgi:formate dehydrogenase iron-sulfur subunit
MSGRAFVPHESVANALGAAELARALAASGTEVSRNGSRGLLWAEPMLEIERDGRRTAYGNVAATEVERLEEHELGPVDELLGGQRRLVFANCGAYEPTDLAAYRALGGFAGPLPEPQAVIDEVKASGLRGYGGAGLPAGTKWQTAADVVADQKYIVANADEGDSGTFADRLIMEGEPYLLIDGMRIAGHAIGATRGVIYLRSEYPLAAEVLTQAIAQARAAGVLGETFDVDLFIGAGAYICGEATSLLESLEGRRGEIRVKPPPMAVRGLFGQPTVVNNVVTLATVPVVLARGAAHHRGFGIGRSRGTLTAQLAGNVRRGGLVEVPFGITLRELLQVYGGGTASGRPLRAVQVGGPLGAYVPEQQWDVPMDYEEYARIGAMIGHGSVVVHDDTADMAQLARFAMAFCALESCGKCTPCRIGSVRGVEIIDRIIAGEDRQRQIALLRDLAETMIDGSLCAMGAMAPVPVLSALDHYPRDFGAGDEHASDRTAQAG